MNVHEQLDRFLTTSPRTKVLIAVATAIMVIAILALAFWLGSRAGDGWAQDRYMKERSENLIRIAKHEQNERKLAGENAVLKRQHEEIAAERTVKDRQIAAYYAQRDQDRKTELIIKNAEIDRQSDAPIVICRTCEAARKGGYPLSAEFCGECYQQH